MNYLRLRQSIIVLALLIFSTLSIQAQDFRRARPDRLGFDVERLERLNPILQSYIDEEKIAGSVTLVLRNGRIAYSSAKGMQNIETNIAMANDTIFRIASQTKAIVSTGIMILHEKGVLLITDPLSKFFPEWANAQVGEVNAAGEMELVPLNRPITLRDLLTHTSGIGYGGFASTSPIIKFWEQAGIAGWYLASRNEPIADIVRKMAAIPQEAQPGEQWKYGYNLDILGAVIEVASGKPLDEFLNDEIFEPLSMEDTHFFLPRDKANRLAVVYRGNPDGGINPAPDEGSAHGQGEYVEGPRMTFSGGAGLLSTASDYAKFLQMTLNGGEFNGTRILSPKTIELMTTNHLNEIPFQPGVGMGLGFSVLADLGTRGTLGSAGEYGWGGAYHSTYWVDPVEKLVVVYLTQILSPGPGLDDFAKLRAGIYQAIVE